MRLDLCITWGSRKASSKKEACALLTMENGVLLSLAAAGCYLHFLPSLAVRNDALLYLPLALPLQDFQASSAQWK